MLTRKLYNRLRSRYTGISVDIGINVAIGLGSIEIIVIYCIRLAYNMLLNAKIKILECILLEVIKEAPY